MATGEMTRELTGLDARALPDDILRSPEPVVLRGLVSHWPLVRAGLESAQQACDYVKRFYRGNAVWVQAAPSEVKGRFFYNADLSGLNFSRAKAPLDQVLDELLRIAGNPETKTLYVGSTDIDACLPGFRAENDVALGGRQAENNIWIGNRTRVPAHHDGPNNLACVAVGRRRFTLFPPDEVGNLYIGPFELTPAGQPISLVDFANPDFTRFPRFARALERARVLELAPGDALIIPSLWWHHIEGLDDLNMLINYWWESAPAYADAPLLALLMAMTTIRDLPPEQRTAWEAQFRHYVFEADQTTAAHVPENRRGSLGKLDADIVARMRAYILRYMKR